MRRSRAVASLLFGSGACALVYQVAWQREFRHIFGASTAASAAVLAIFIGGMGLGGLLLGRVADRHPRPLALYAGLEALIGLAAAATPALLWLVGRAYVAAGGTGALGPVAGTAARLVLAALVLLPPTLLMGGTLPAAARGVETDDDRGRRGVALLYGVNTLGAVAGSLLATFLLLEILGTRSTLWVAALVNLLVAVTARSFARGQPAVAAEGPASVGAPAPPDGSPAPRPKPAAPVPFVLGASAVVGFAFFLMELVWYRMLGPLLGGTVFTFGLILAIALLGIGLGGALRASLRPDRPATLAAFAWTCLLEAACVALPFALGDRIAVLALLLRPLGGVGFVGHVLAWAVVTAIVVLPAAIVAGFQYPALIALLGGGRQGVGRHVGLASASNTVGAVAGALAGGFGLLPWLGAPGCWRLVIAVLLLLGLAAIGLSAATERRWRSVLAPAGVAVGAAALLAATGPTAAWRHSPIGVGRVALEELDTPNGLRAWVHRQRRAIVWEAEGVESSVALSAEQGLAFVINGKIDGSARGDAGTQVMSGLVGALLHPAPARALVIGLGTGSTAGWLAAVPGMERVDVVELEPAIVEVARACAPVNHDALADPRLRLILGDAREALLTSRAGYDLIVSEPSNPYRAGIASLFTVEYYGAAARRLRDGGIFLQWVQTYEVDGLTVRIVYATLAAVFPHVETWELAPGDILLVASRRPIAHDLAALRARVAREPFHGGLAAAWSVTGVEGFLSHFLAGPELAREVAARHRGDLNTDDRTVLEFGFARGVSRHDTFLAGEIRAAARALGTDWPAHAGGTVDRALAEDLRTETAALAGLPLPEGLEGDALARALAFVHYRQGDLPAALAAWRRQPRPPAQPMEHLLVAEALAAEGDEAALAHAVRLRELRPVEADAVLARLRARQGRLEEAAAALEASFVAFRRDPWPATPALHRALRLAEEIAARAPALAPRLLEAVREPFSVRALDDVRLRSALALAARVDRGATCARAAAAFEPHVPWELDFLALRLECYRGAGDRRAGRAAADLDAFVAAAPRPFAP